MAGSILSWFCAQIGAREHYAIPRALYSRGRLRTLYADFWASLTYRRVLGSGSFGPLRSLAGRYHPGLAEARIESWNVRSVASEVLLRFRSKVRSPWSRSPVASSPYHGFIEIGRKFACNVRDSLNRRSDLGPESIFFAYDTGALETLEWCHDRGIRCIVNQIDPNRVEVDLVCEESKLWPGWQPYPVEVPEEYFRRREQEWALADRVVVNSAFCRDALIKQGVPPSKLVVIPLSYEIESGGEVTTNPKPGSATPSQLSAFSFSASRPLRVLFLGQVILRKGIQYLVEAAKLLEGENIQFDIVGPIGISEDAVRSAPANMKFHGRANRDQAADWYRAADVFVLPTISDGFAITQIEAMAYGLPVVTTPCCGDVVTDGVDGFILAPRDPEALAKTLLRYAQDPDLLRSHREAALVKSKQFTLEHLAANLLKLEESLCKQ